MDEKLSEERKAEIQEVFNEILDKGILTNGDVLGIIDILKAACERDKAMLYEEMMERLVNGDDAE